jgi:hypothetical protein
MDNSIIKVFEQHFDDLKLFKTPNLNADSVSGYKNNNFYMVSIFQSYIVTKDNKYLLVGGTTEEVIKCLLMELSGFPYPINERTKTVSKINGIPTAY